MINIASVTDSDFVDVLMTSYVSILENNLDDEFHFYVIDDKLTQNDKDYLQQLPKIYGNLKKITFIKVNNKYYKKASLDAPTSAVKENTYYKIELPLLVPVSRLLYLDADTICCGSISKLWKTNLHGKPAGAVEDGGYGFAAPVPSRNYRSISAIGNFNKIAPGNDGNYFNGGLILFDIPKWKAQHLTEKTRKIVADKGKDLLWQDQDALNVILNRNWQMLDPKYNVQSHTVKGEVKNRYPQRRKLELAALQNPVIIHYTEWNKPWVRTGKYVHPWRNQYFWYKYIATMRLHNYAVNQKAIQT